MKRKISKQTLVSWIIFLCLICTLSILSCATVPKEVVELSYRTGQDMRSMQESYDRLIHEFYEQLRDRRLTYIEDEWTPRFIQNWLEIGKLIEVARGEYVWSEEEAAFVTPSPDNKEKELLQTVLTWAEVAVDKIEIKKAELLKPLYDDEDSLRFAVSEAMNQLIQANATITAHLNSLREVQEIQDDVLSALGIKGIRDKINDALASASEKANDGLEIIRKADNLVDEVEDVKNKIDDEGGQQ